MRISNIKLQFQINAGPQKKKEENAGTLNKIMLGAFISNLTELTWRLFEDRHLKTFVLIVCAHPYWARNSRRNVMPRHASSTRTE